MSRYLKVRDLDVFYRAAGPKDAPAVLLLHGFPTSSQMFRDLIAGISTTEIEERIRRIAGSMSPCHA
jgi:pimeloyl-ACP methyl ester carboxylesterase